MILSKAVLATEKVGAVLATAEMEAVLATAEMIRIPISLVIVLTIADSAYVQNVLTPVQDCLMNSIQ